jgi:hypothetical protein
MSKKPFILTLPPIPEETEQEVQEETIDIPATGSNNESD